jgi:hypothetical protein
VQTCWGGEKKGEKGRGQGAGGRVFMLVCEYQRLVNGVQRWMNEYQRLVNGVQRWINEYQRLINGVPR